MAWHVAYLETDTHESLAKAVDLGTVLVPSVRLPFAVHLLVEGGGVAVRFARGVEARHDGGGGHLGLGSRAHADVQADLGICCENGAGHLQGRRMLAAHNVLTHNVSTHTNIV